MTVDLRTSAVRAVAAADDGPGFFVVADGRLLSTVGRGPEAEVVCELSNIREVGGPHWRWKDKPLELRLYVHGPWVCVTERLGVNATLVNTVTGLVRELSREDYHADMSSYSIGFVEREGRTVLIAQTEWNRLDIFDAETGELLTDREIVEPGMFHSFLQVSPDSRHFLGHGWVWMPQDRIGVYSVDDFLQSWEDSAMLVDGRGYAWDRPATFISDHDFVVALDDWLVGEHVDPEDEPGYEYRQLGIFTIPSPLTPEGEARWLDPAVRVDCDVFPVDEHGEVFGELHHDKASGHLVALNANGAFLVRLDGSVVEHLPETTFKFWGVEDSETGGKVTGWQYSTGRRLFYRWRDGVGIEERSFSWAGADGSSGLGGAKGARS